MESSVTFNKGITQIVGNRVRSTMKKDYSFVSMTDVMDVKVSGERQLLKVKEWLFSNGYNVETTLSAEEKFDHTYLKAIKK